MEIIKFQSGQVLAHIRHDLREIPSNKTYKNESIDSTLTHLNYSLINRGKNAEEVNAYRLKLEKEIFKFNRKNLVHAVEVAIQCPADCPEDQKEAFFQESFNFICSTLPMGEKCVFVAQVHRDEKYYTPSGEMISKDHLHIMYVPAVPDTKHENFEYKMCADQLTRKSSLNELHPALQRHLNHKNINATVIKKKKSDGKTISLSVKQLKALTKNTGITLNKSITIDELAHILVENVQLKEKNKVLEQEIEQINSQNDKQFNWDHTDNVWDFDNASANSEIQEWESEKEW